MAVFQWSKVADNNATADPTVNWAEGQPPPTINNSARAMMARLAEWRDDLGGAFPTTGTGSAYSLTSNQGFPSTPPIGAQISFCAHTMSGLFPTLTVDGGNVYQIWGVSGTFAAPGTLRPNVLYTATFAGTGWIIHQAQSSFAVPIGGLMDYTSAILPAGGNFIFPYGQAISRAVYSDYYGLVGTTFGGGDGTTTFNVPNLKGRLTAAFDGLGDGVPANILTTIPDVPGATGGSQYHTIAQANLPSYTLTGPGVSFGVSGTTGQEDAAHVHNVVGDTGIQSADHTHSYAGASNTIVVGSTGVAASGSPTTQQTGGVSANHTHHFDVFTGGETTIHHHSFSAGGTTAGLAVSSGGSGTAINDLPPIMKVYKILRII